MYNSCATYPVDSEMFVIFFSMCLCCCDGSTWVGTLMIVTYHKYFKIKGKEGSKMANTCQRKCWIPNMQRRKIEKIEKENNVTGAILKKAS